MATISPEAPEKDENIGAIFLWKFLKPLDSTPKGMGHQQAEAVRNVDCKKILLGFHVRESDDCKGAPPWVLVSQ